MLAWMTANWQHLCLSSRNLKRTIMEKKKIILGLALLACITGSAQEKKSSAILRGGVNLANVSVTDNGGIDDAKMLTSFQVGVIGDLNITSFLALQPGVIFTGKGTKTQSGNESDANFYRATSNPYYVEVPVNLVFKTPTGSSNFFIGAGPYIAMGIAGKNKIEGKIKMKKVMNKVETHKSSRGLKFTNKSQRNHSSIRRQRMPGIRTR